MQKAIAPKDRHCPLCINRSLCVDLLPHDCHQPQPLELLDQRLRGALGVSPQVIRRGVVGHHGGDELQRVEPHRRTSSDPTLLNQPHRKLTDELVAAADPAAVVVARAVGTEVNEENNSLKVPSARDLVLQ